MPKYAFRTLSSEQFEELVRDLLQAEWGVTLETFKAGRDEGVDNRLVTEDEETIVQSKHYVASGYKTLLRKLKKDEVPKVERLAPSRYVVATSVPLSPSNKREIAALFEPTREQDVYGGNDLDNLLSKHPHVERRHHELWLQSVEPLQEMLDPLKEEARRAADAAEETLGHLLAQNEASGVLHDVLQRQVDPVAPLIRADRLDEAAGILHTRIADTLSLRSGRGAQVRDLLDRHTLALRIQLGNTLARGGDLTAAQEQFAAVSLPDEVPEELVFEAARLASNVRDADALAALRERLPEGTPEHRSATLWEAGGRNDWEAVLTALDAFDHDDTTRKQHRARALVELGRDRLRTVDILDAAWNEATTSRLRLSIAMVSADLIGAVVKGEEVAVDLDRPALIEATTKRFRAATETASTEFLKGLAHVHAAHWFGFLEDKERHDIEMQALDALDLTADQRLRLVVDPELDDAELNRHTREGTVDPFARDLTRANRYRAGNQPRREERALWSALANFEAESLPDLKVYAIERLIELQIEAKDEPNARLVLEELVSDDPVRPLLEAKITLAFDGDEAARRALAELLDERPLCRPALRNLFYLHAEAALSTEGEVRSRHLTQAETLVERLYKLVPTRAILLAHAGYLNRLGKPLDAVEIYERLEAQGERSWGLLTSKASALDQADRLPDAAQTLEEAYALDTSKAETGTNAGQVWLNATRFDAARIVLEQVVEDHPAAAMPRAYLGVARLHAQEDEVRRTALEALETALALEPNLGIPPLILVEAAAAADAPDAVRRYMARATEGARRVEITTADDVSQALQLEPGEAVVQGQFRNKDSIRAVVEHMAKQAEALDGLATSDMAPYASYARRPWSNGLTRTYTYERLGAYKEPQSQVVRFPWPSEIMLRPLGFEGEHPLVGPSDGLLVELTALVTLTSIGALEEALRIAANEFGRVVLYPGALPDLRGEIRTLTSGLAWQRQRPSEQTVVHLERHRLGPRPDEPDPADLADLVPASAARELGNSTPDVGLALHLEAGFVTHAGSFEAPEERMWGGRTWTAPEVLKALRSENRIGQSQAEAIASAAPGSFGGWESEDPPPLEPLVVTGFVLTDWFASGLLDLWAQNAGDWPPLRVGPFGIALVRGEVAEQTERARLLDTLKSTRDTLDGLVSEGVIEALPTPPEPEGLPSDAEGIESEDVTTLVWGSATALLDEAAQRNLHVWADDRALGFLLWPYKTPISTPKVDAAARRIRERYAGTSLLSTEMVLDQLSDSLGQRADELGWKLYTHGHRPLLGRLALRYLIADYGPPFDSATYRDFFSGLAALQSFLPPESILTTPYQSLYLNVAVVPILDGLLEVIWNGEGLSESERTALGGSVIDSFGELLTSLPAPLLGQSVARLMLSLKHRHDSEDPAPVPAAWLGDALVDRMSASRVRSVAHAIEEMAVHMYRSIRDRAVQELIDENTPQDEIQQIERAATRIGAQLAWEKLAPILGSRLLDVHAPLLRRLIALLAGHPDAGQATRHIPVDDIGTVPVEEEEIERVAVNAFWAAAEDPQLRHLIGLTRVHGGWNRSLPEAEDPEETSTGDVPDRHGVDIDLPYLTLALRDADVHEAILAQLAHGLDFVDPVLRERVRELHPRLTDDDPAIRARAIEQLADEAIGSTALDLERGLAHAADRLRIRSLDDLNKWLFNPKRPEDPFDHPNLVEGPDGRFPRATLRTAILLSLEPDQLDSQVASVAEASVQRAEDQGASTHEMVTALARTAASEGNSFSALYELLVLLYVARDHPEANVTLGGETQLVRDWAREFIEELLGVESVTSPRRLTPLRWNYAYALRLAIHACSGPHILAELYHKANEDEATVAAQWTTGVLIAADRLLAFAADRYPDPFERAYHLREACETLGFRVDQPGRTFDRFNPMLFGPGLIDHERWFLLHALEASWGDLDPAPIPFWWSERIAEALRHIAVNPNPHEGLLLDPGAQNGLGIAAEGTPAELAEALLERSRTTPPPSNSKGEETSPA